MIPIKREQSFCQSIPHVVCQIARLSMFHFFLHRLVWFFQVRFSQILIADTRTVFITVPNKGVGRWLVLGGLCSIMPAMILGAIPALHAAAGYRPQQSENSHSPAPTLPIADCQDPVDQKQEKKLFDGKSLEGWKITQFGGDGECLVEDGLLIMEPGFPLTGLTSTLTNLPPAHYEIEVIARKTAGIDFFIGLTFPINDSHGTLIVGGWAGPVVGISMIDGKDAANNETRKLMKFELNRWYRIRVRVVPDKVQAWIDDELVVDLLTEGKSFSVRNETLATRPLGICNFETRTEIKSIVLRELAPNPDPSKQKDSHQLPSAEGNFFNSPK